MPILLRRALCDARALLVIVLLAGACGSSAAPTQPLPDLAEEAANSLAVTPTAQPTSIADLSGSNGARATAPLSDEDLNVAPEPASTQTPAAQPPTPSPTPPPTAVPYLYPFNPALQLTDSGGTYERGSAPCDEALYDPLWVSVTRFVWVCDDGTVVALDATIDHEVWISELPVDGLHRRIGRTDETTAAIDSGIVDATMFTSPAVGLGAETYELVLTSIDGESGARTGQLVFPASNDRYLFWWSPAWSRAILTFQDDTGTWRVLIVDTTTGTILADRSDLRIVHDAQQIESRYVPVEIKGNEDTYQFIDLDDATLTPASTPLHGFFEHYAARCSPFLLVKTGLLDNSWQLLNPTTTTPPVALPNQHWPDQPTGNGALIHSNQQWAMLTPVGITWTLERGLARQPRFNAGELSFENQSGDRIAIDPVTGKDLGPAEHGHFRQYDTTADGTYITEGRTTTYIEEPACP